MSLYSKIRGTFETVFQLGKGGPQFKNNSGAVLVRNSADSAYANLGAATVQLDGGALIKNNSGVLEVRNAGDLAYANIKGDEVVATQAVLGTFGTIVKEAADGVISVRLSDDSDFAVIRASSTPTTNDDLVTKGYFDANPPAGTVRSIAFLVDESLGDATQSSTATIPANAIVLSYHVNVLSAFASGQTMTVGYAADADALLAAGDTNMELTSVYTIDEPQQWHSSAAAVLATLSSATVGSGQAMVIVTYAESLS